ncbi:MAG: hypothetical protein HDR72_02655 [Ruminococcaceae bacterium]|nr:hypothetical protein [Oscillospiraceae bacterium]
MTVGEMREIMRSRVVPEDLVPQNVISLLMDDEETAAPPELDAFTFLTRLRALGIGSADFMYLMEGCEAPQAVVDKIRNNPAMNLQGLILTLENSELTADDYKRILYTARQIWERTLTLRLEKSEMVLQGGDEPQEDYSEPTFEEVMDELGQIDDTHEGDDISEYEEFRAAFVTEELAPPVQVTSGPAVEEIAEPVEEEMPAEIPVEETPVGEEVLEEVPDEEAPVEETVEESTIEKSAVEAEPVGEVPVEESLTKEEPAEEEDVDVPDEYLEFAEYSDQPVYTEEIEAVKQPYNGDTTAIVQIDAEMLRQNLALLAEEEQAAVRAEAARVAAEQAQQEARAAYEAARADEAQKNTEENSEESGEEQTEETEELEGKKEREPFIVRIPNEHPYHKGAIITAAAGAAVVFGASFGVTLIPEPPVIRSITYAEDNAAIFNEIYYSYYDNIVGGEKAREPVFDYNKIFGDLLVTADGFGTFSEGDNVYTVTSEAVSASAFRNGTLTEAEEILPPDGTRIVNVFDDNGALVAVFSGTDDCGFMRISGGKALFTVRQDGFITDFDYKDGDILIGSVYTPRFTRTFGIQDSMIYMPRLGVGEKNALRPQSVIPSGTKGYSYGISAAYSTANGATRSAVAVLGNPISASTDGRFILSGEEDLLMTVGAEEITAVKAEGIQLAAFCDDGSATYEGGNINLRDRDGNVVAAIANPAQTVTSMWFDGNLLRLSGVNGVFITMDCSVFTDPKVAELRTVSGAVSGENAVIFGTGANSLTLSHYKLVNGTASLVNTYTKALSPELLNTLEFGGINTVIADGVRFGAGYRYFDGVSVMSEYAVMEDSGQVSSTKELFDDRTGFTLAFKHNGNIYAQCGGGIVDMLN